jgi:hypothetical protein
MSASVDKRTYTWIGFRAFWTNWRRGGFGSFEEGNRKVGDLYVSAAISCTHDVSEEVENGARLTFTPTDPANLTELRIQVRADVERMKKGECLMRRDRMRGMMRGMGGGMGNPKEHTK